VVISAKGEAIIILTVNELCMKSNKAVPNNTYNHTLIVSCLCTTVHTNTFCLETGLNLTLTLHVLCQNIHFKIFRIFLWFEEYPEQYIVLQIEVTQYDINWQQQTNYQICIKVNRNCNVSSWTRFLPTLNGTDVLKGLNCNWNRENITLLTERMIMKLQKLYKREIWFVTD